MLAHREAAPMSDPGDNWFVPPPSERAAGEVLYVDVDGYEGPLDLLLELARRQKVDLSAISVLSLAEQYIGFIERVQSGRLEIAADYLVMAAWLAYLKSRLMVPQSGSDEEPSGEMLAAMLQFRLKRLEAMREATGKLLRRARLGQQIFARGMPEPIHVSRSSQWSASLYDLLKAYAGQRERSPQAGYTPFHRTVWSLQDARDILRRLIGDNVEWVALDSHLARYLDIPDERATARASSFASSLELVRLGEIDLRQSETFGPLLMRRRKAENS